MLDNYDSFTWNLVDYLRRLGVEVNVIRNDELTLEELTQFKWKGIVLSPGPREPQQSGILMDVIAHYHQQLPILGICLGHQAIGSYFGWELFQLNEPFHGKTSLLQHIPHPMYSHCPDQFSVCRYHSLALKEFEGCGLISTAWTDDQKNGRVCMSFVHESYPLWGVQYHPEAILSEWGLQLLENWLNVFNLRA